MEICKRCKLAKKCGASSESDFCLNYEPSSQTNYDLLISKTPEELAVICEDGCPPQYECPPIKREEMGLRSVCQKCWLDWLKSPVEVEE